MHNYVEHVVPQYEDEYFRRFFRMSRQTLQALCGYLLYCKELTVKGTGGREPITIEKQLLITLWYIGSLDPIVRIADRFGVSESSVIMSRNRVITALLNNVKHRVTHWPYGPEVQDVVDKFSRRNGFPGNNWCLG